METKKNKIKIKKMTFGFEIEGIFIKELKNTLGSGWVYKTDGSVNIKSSEPIKLFEFNKISPINVFMSYNAVNNFITDSSGDLKTEINSPVFKNLKVLLKNLAVFKFNKNYFSNKSCGIHIHIGFNDDKLKKLDLSDFAVIKDLQDYAVNNLCPHIKDRIVSNHFCKPYNTDKFNYSYNDFKNREKYSFMGNHSSGTFEFRFFSACEHKDENAELFFNYLNKRLKNYVFKAKVKNILQNKNKSLVIKDIIDGNDKNLTFKEAISSINKELKLAYNINSKIELPIGSGLPATFLETAFMNYVARSTATMPAMPSPRITRIESNTRGIVCGGYHNNCGCDTCVRRFGEGLGCSDRHCQDCRQGCGDVHCDICGTGDFCDSESCDYCREYNVTAYNLAFSHN